jgi:hypothetical protein
MPRGKIKRRVTIFAGFAALFVIALPILPFETDFATGIQIGAEKGRFFNLNVAISKFHEFLSVIESWGQSYWNIALALLIVVYGSQKYLERTQNKITVLLILLFSLISTTIVGSSFLRGFPPNLTERFWVPISVLLVGLMGNALIRWANDVSEIIWRKESVSRQKLLLTAGFTIVVFLAGVDNGKFLLRHFPSTVESRINRGNLVINNEQPASVYSSKRTLAIFFSDPIVMHFYLSQGGMSQTALLTALEKTPAQVQRWSAAEMPLFQVIRNPIGRSTFANQGRLEIQNNSKWIFDFSKMPESPETIYLLISNEGKETSLKLEEEANLDQSGWDLEIQVPAQFSDWIAVDISETQSAKVSLMANQLNSSLTISGLQVKKHQLLFWPWDSGVGLYDPQTDKRISFDTRDLTVSPGFELEIKNDSGDYILGELIAVDDSQ